MGPQTKTNKGRPPEAASPSLLWSTVDFTRCCCSHEGYDAWMAQHGLTLGAAGVAHYFACAAQALEEQSYAAQWQNERWNEWAARELLADVLITSAPLSGVELRCAAWTSLHEVCQETNRLKPTRKDEPPGAESHV